MMIGSQDHDLRTRALLLGMVPLPAAEAPVDARALGPVLATAERCVQEGADLLIVPGEQGGDRVAGVLAALHERFDLPIAVSLAGAGAEVVAPLVQAGASMVVGLGSTSDAAFVAITDAKAVVVVRTEWRRADGAADAEQSLLEAATAAIRLVEAAGVARQRIGLELTSSASSGTPATLLGPADRLVALGCPVLVSLAPWDDDPNDAVAAASLAVLRGRRLICTQHVKAVRRSCDVVSAVLEADR